MRVTGAGVMMLAALACQPTKAADEAGAPPADINAAFVDPNVDDFVQRFEVESREVYDQRQRILDACHVREGATVADIGAGTGLFTRLFSQAVGAQGRVIAVDISEEFLAHIAKASLAAGQRNVEVIQCTQESTLLPPRAVDLAFICDTYHHFEHPQKTLASIARALKPEGRVVVVDYRRIEGESSEWTLNHVRAGQETFEKEIIEAGFEKTDELQDGLKENYLVVFKLARRE